MKILIHRSVNGLVDEFFYCKWKSEDFCLIDITENYSDKYENISHKTIAKKTKKEYNKDIGKKF